MTYWRHHGTTIIIMYMSNHNHSLIQLFMVHIHICWYNYLNSIMSACIIHDLSCMSCHASYASEVSCVKYFIKRNYWYHTLSEHLMCVYNKSCICVTVSVSNGLHIVNYISLIPCILNFLCIICCHYVLDASLCYQL